MTQKVACPDGPCVCRKGDLFDLLRGVPHNVDMDDVTFCGGVCDGANVGDTCTVGCSDASGLTPFGTAKFNCVRSMQGEGQWVND